MLNPNCCANNQRTELVNPSLDAEILEASRTYCTHEKQQEITNDPRTGLYLDRVFELNEQEQKGFILGALWGLRKGALGK